MNQYHPRQQKTRFAELQREDPHMFDLARQSLIDHKTQLFGEVHEVEGCLGRHACGCSVAGSWRRRRGDPPAIDRVRRSVPAVMSKKQLRGMSGAAKDRA
jgi:hypothetical protein